MTVPGDGRVGLVLSGGGPRGAYEAGALSVLLPWLDDRGERPAVLIGTSAGAINSVLLASRAHVPARQAAQELEAFWLSLKPRDVVRGIVPTTLRNAARAVGQVLRIPNVRVRSLLDPKPLGGTLDRSVGSWQQIADNVHSGPLAAVAVAATDARTGWTVVFVDSRHPAPPPSREKGIEYIQTPLALEHVLASSAIPVAFPPVQVAHPAPIAGWYMDGGTRLNTPLKPALDLGVTRVAVISGEPAVFGAPPSAASREGELPDFDDALLHVLQATIGDALVEDVYRLAQVNELVKEGVTSKHEYPYLFVGPRTRGEIGKVAEEAYEAGSRWGDAGILSLLTGRQGAQRAELLGYVLWEQRYLRRLVELGREHARWWVEAGWRTRPLG